MSQSKKKSLLKRFEFEAVANSHSCLAPFWCGSLTFMLQWNLTGLNQVPPPIEIKTKNGRLRHYFEERTQLYCKQIKKKKKLVLFELQCIYIKYSVFILRDRSTEDRKWCVKRERERECDRVFHNERRCSVCLEHVFHRQAVARTVKRRIKRRMTYVEFLYCQADYNDHNAFPMWTP